MKNTNADWAQNNRELHGLAAQIEGGGLSPHDLLKEAARNTWGATSLKHLSPPQQCALAVSLKRVIANQQNLVSTARVGKCVYKQIRAITALRYKLNWTRARLLKDVATCYGWDSLEDLEHGEAQKYIQRLKKINANKKET